ncbi:MAG: phosphorylase [Hyphomicrobiales bacterium]|nr:phosphorylase [Hyphomicrobiales bacterium]
MSQQQALLGLIHQRATDALKSGALQSIETTERVITDAGVPFVVRSVSSLRLKADQSPARPSQDPSSQQGRNPFLPYDPDLFVTDLGDTHVCLLNKFNVMPHHVLIVTRRYESQDEILTQSDFQALWHGQTSIQGLCFYNGGAAAGASQPHKHLQIVPLPLSPSGPELPVEAIVNRPDMQGAGYGGVSTGLDLPFRHAFARLDGVLDGALNGANASAHTRSARGLYDLYRSLLSAAGIALIATADGGWRTNEAYNLLVTQRWMLVVPRVRDSDHGISVNALGFAGSLFVRDEHDLHTLETLGPMTLLRNVSHAL